jgi:hypothetical protein
MILIMKFFYKKIRRQVRREGYYITNIMWRLLYTMILASKVRKVAWLLTHKHTYRVYLGPSKFEEMVKP